MAESSRGGGCQVLRPPDRIIEPLEDPGIYYIGVPTMESVLWRDRRRFRRMVQGWRHCRRPTRRLILVPGTRRGNVKARE
jgi:hypothetical protein